MQDEHARFLADAWQHRAQRAATDGERLALMRCADELRQGIQADADVLARARAMAAHTTEVRTWGANGAEKEAG